MFSRSECFDCDETELYGITEGVGAKIVAWRDAPSSLEIEIRQIALEHHRRKEEHHETFVRNRAVHEARLINARETQRCDDVSATSHWAMGLDSVGKCSWLCSQDDLFSVGGTRRSDPAWFFAILLGRSSRFFTVIIPADWRRSPTATRRSIWLGEHGNGSG